MAMSIWKYKLDVAKVQKIPMKRGAEVLSIHNQGESICVWALVNDKAKEDKGREFLIFGTGHPIPNEGVAKVDLAKYIFVGTVHMAGGELVLHVFVGK